MQVLPKLGYDTIGAVAQYAFTPRVSNEDIKVVLTFDSVDEILWCDYSDETSSAVLLHDNIIFKHFTK